MEENILERKELDLNKSGCQVVGCLVTILKILSFFSRLIWKNGTQKI
jgi:hypothetical protein